ncbi:MAG: ABC transporter ATP-binding protein [Candidatus Omnitrophota bacterium]|nr:ABC transporter ATP-binding protein [Candidatus Omnitrophota bacterium]
MVAQNKKAPAIQLEEISRIYQMAAGEVAALSKINLTVEQGEYMAVMGPSGSGKTTLLNLLGCLDQPSSGRYYLGGEDVSALPDDQLSEIRNRKIGFIFQSYNLIPELTVLENIEIPLFYRSHNDPDGLQRAVRLAEMVGLGSRLDHRPAQLSGGQQQRVAIARSLVNDPLIILADEPTGNLDSTTGQEILSVLHEMHRQGKTLVVITHDVSVAQHSSRTIHIVDGRIKG